MAYDKSVPFSFTKNGIYYFERRVPVDLQKHYSTKKIAYSLRTRSASVATSRATKAAHHLDEYWYHLRIQESQLPGKHFIRKLSNVHVAAEPLSSGPPNPQRSLELSEAVSMYLKLKGQNKPLTFHRAAERACGYVIDACGDKDLLAYSKADATRFRDALVERKLTGSSITRIFGTVRSVVNFAPSEVGVTIINPFTGVYYDRNLGVQDRLPFALEDIATVQKECLR